MAGIRQVAPGTVLHNGRTIGVLLDAVDAVVRNADARPEPNEHVLSYMAAGGNPDYARGRRNDWDSMTPHQATELNTAARVAGRPPRYVSFRRYDRESGVQPEESPVGTAGARDCSSPSSRRRPATSTAGSASSTPAGSKRP